MARKKSRAPACPIYVRDYMADEHVIMMDLEQEAAYLRLLFHQWLEGDVPDDLPSLARIVRTTPQKMRRIWPRVAPKFVSAGPGRLRNETLEMVRQESQEYRARMSANGKQGANRRWNGKANGNANSNAIAEVWPASASAIAVPPSIEKEVVTEGHPADIFTERLVAKMAMGGDRNG